VGGGAETKIMKNQNGRVAAATLPNLGNAERPPVVGSRTCTWHTACLSRRTTGESADDRKGVPQMEGQSKTTFSEVAWAVVAMTVLAFMLWINQ
jgi:hypothetical protein